MWNKKIDDYLINQDLPDWTLITVYIFDESRTLAIIALYVDDLLLLPTQSKR